jgi:hypothetical protein
MKKVLLLVASIMMVANVAMADHIGLYTDPTGSSCFVAAPLSNGQVHVIHKFTLGTTGSRFQLDTAGAPGTFVFTFISTWSTIGNYVDLSVGYSGCQPAGTVYLGSFFGNFGAGMLQIIGAGADPAPTYTDCDFAAQNAIGGKFYIGTEGNCGEVATEPSTWGQVKALYR